MSASGAVQDDPILTVYEAAAVLRCHSVTLYRLVESGELKAARLGRVLRVRQSDLFALFDSKEQSTMNAPTAKATAIGFNALARDGREDIRAHACSAPLDGRQGSEEG